MVSIKLIDQDATRFKIDTDPGTMQELREHFTFVVPGSEFHPSVRNGYWDGKIRLIDGRTKTLYSGLSEEVRRFAKEMDYDFTHDRAETKIYTPEDVQQVAQDISLKLEIRPYQMDAILSALNNRNRLLLSPTASGKSLIIYVITQVLKLKTLIIVPNISLVEQMTTDFEDYGYDSSNNVHKIFYGKEKNSDRAITISTWQSIVKMPESYFSDFEVVIGDECHLFAAKSLLTIMNALKNAYYRIGTTGSLTGSKTHEMVIQGLFGPIERVATTKELMEKGYVAELEIKCLVIRYPETIAKMAKGMDYADEMKFLIGMEDRNKFIANLALNMKGNVLILCQYVKEHAIPLHELVRSIVPPDRNVYLIVGKVDPEERERIRKILETENDAILVAGVKAFATGSNVKNIRHMIFTAPSKSMVTVLQSIGRGIRRSPTKTKATLIDIVDDLTYKGKSNYAKKHFLERTNIYSTEEFPYKIINVGNIHEHKY